MNEVILTNGKVLIDREFEQTDILIQDGIIVEIGSRSLSKLKGQIIDVKEAMILPGFIDIHTHGGNGVDVNQARVDQLHELSDFYASKGVTSYLPTLLTDKHETICKILKTINKAKKQQKTGATILGTHMEGPFLSENFKGAMPGHLIQESCIEKFKAYEQASGDSIKYMTVSVEHDKIEELIRYAKSKNIVISLGHTGGSYEHCMACIRAGASSVTHLFNAMEPLHHRDPSIIGAALESDVYTELICDGRHLHPAIVGLVLKAKGMERVIAITDSIMATGLGDGNYKLGINDIVVENGDALLAANGKRAGSILTMDQVLANIMKFTNKPIEKCIGLITQNPARLLNIHHQKGDIALGKDADLVVLDRQYTVQRTLVKGKTVYERGKL